MPDLMASAGTIAAAAGTAIKTTSGESINTGIWTLVGVVVVAVCGVATAIVKQWGPWKVSDSDARAADFARLRDEIATLKSDHREEIDKLTQRIGKLEELAERARADATEATEHAMRSDAKLHTALTACEVLLGLVEREMPDAAEIGLVKRLLAQAAADDMGIGAGMRKIATMRGVGE